MYKVIFPKLILVHGSALPSQIPPPLTNLEMKAASGSSLIHRVVVTDNLEIPQNHQVSLRVSWGGSLQQAHHACHGTDCGILTSDT